MKDKRRLIVLHYCNELLYIYDCIDHCFLGLLLLFFIIWLLTLILIDYLNDYDTD